MTDPPSARLLDYVAVQQNAYRSAAWRTWVVKDKQLNIAASTTASKSTDAVPLAKTKGPIELDMGEASREQGFCLNGCR